MKINNLIKKVAGLVVLVAVGWVVYVNFGLFCCVVRQDLWNNTGNFCNLLADFNTEVEIILAIFCQLSSITCLAFALPVLGIKTAKIGFENSENLDHNIGCCRIRPNRFRQFGKF